MKPAPKISSNLTSYTGYCINASYDELQKILGEPFTIMEISQNWVWHVLNADGKICTIYDWYCNKRIKQDRDGRYKFNIGAHENYHGLVLKNELEIELMSIRTFKRFNYGK